MCYYFCNSNSGGITHLSDPGMLERARDVLDRAARERGFLAGCNALFLELPLEHVGGGVEAFREAVAKGDFLRVKAPFRVPRRAGLRVGAARAREAMLLAHLSEFVPVDPALGNFLPASVVRGYVEDRWRAARECGILPLAVAGMGGAAAAADPDYEGMRQQLMRMTRVPLLPRPWSHQGDEDFVYINLGNTYDEALLTAWYNTVFKPNFPLEDEVESLESLQKGLLATAGEGEDDPHMLLEIVLAVRWEGSKVIIGGGVVYEYYLDSNCGLISFLVVARVARGKGLSRKLVERASEGLDVLSIEEGGCLSGCNAIFLETNMVQSLTVEQDVMDPRVRQLIYQKMGFKLVDFPYVMPPLAPGKPKVFFLLLLVKVTRKIPSNPTDPTERYLPAVLLQRFLSDLWSHFEQYGRLQCPRVEDPDFILAMEKLEYAEQLPLRDYPWIKGSPWTFINLREVNDAELRETALEALAKAYPERDLSVIRASLDLAELPLGQPSYSLVVALEPPMQESDTADEEDPELQLAGVCVAAYVPNINVGRLFLTLCVPEAETSLRLQLVEQVEALLDSYALDNGHLGGCTLFASVMSDNVADANSTMTALVTRDNASELTFLQVTGLHFEADRSDLQLVMRGEEIPLDDNAVAYLPSRLLMDYAAAVGSPSIEDLLERKSWLLQEVQTEP